MVERPRSQASAQQAGFAGVTRKILERLPMPGNQGLMVVEVTYPPSGVAPLHRHPVAGAIYIIEGVAESAYGSDEPRQYRAARRCRTGRIFRTRTFVIATRTIRSAS
ncbi:cupin domain-containing protein [Bradyrhizobium monzae]|uniref:hypothetical protein n=1 Tax=Bradyrhizobium sp. Oc8 TaxID=2876780 RepID=UPI001F29050D|nr:hypothetical protein [Bradyrhizobium sp. Oc8]